MYRLLFLPIAAGLAIGSSDSVFAADLAVKAPRVAPMAVEPGWNWSGFYVGGHGGGGFGRSEWEERSYCVAGVCAAASLPLGLPVARVGTTQIFGGLAGVQGGFNWQTSRVVFGIEGEFSWADLKGDHDRTASLVGVPPGGGLVQATDTSRYFNQIQNIAILAGRLGVVGGPQDRALFFVKGGAAAVNENFTLNQGATGLFCNANGACAIGVASGQFTTGYHWRWGATVGAGLEVGLFGGWSAKIEYDHIFLGKNDRALNGSYSTLTGCFAAGTCTFPGTVIPAGPFARNFQHDENIGLLKIGLNYKFGGGSVIAAY